MRKTKTNEAQRRKQAESIRKRGSEQMAEHDPSAAVKRQMRHKPYQAAALIREQGPEMFTRIWARKESYLKFTGQGIRVPLNSFEVLPGEQTLPVFFQEFTLEGYRIALCSEEEMAVSLKFLTLEELLF